MNGIYYFANGTSFLTTAGYMANTTDGQPQYVNGASPSYGFTDLPPAVDGTDGVEFVFDGGGRYSADNSDLPTDGSVFFVAPTFVPTGRPPTAFYTREAQ